MVAGPGGIGPRSVYDDSSRGNVLPVPNTGAGPLAGESLWDELRRRGALPWLFEGFGQQMGQGISTIGTGIGMGVREFAEPFAGVAYSAGRTLFGERQPQAPTNIDPIAERREELRNRLESSIISSELQALDRQREVFEQMRDQALSNAEQDVADQYDEQIKRIDDQIASKQNAMNVYAKYNTRAAVQAQDMFYQARGGIGSQAAQIASNTIAARANVAQAADQAVVAAEQAITNLGVVPSVASSEHTRQVKAEAAEGVRSLQEIVDASMTTAGVDLSKVSNQAAAVARSAIDAYEIEDKVVRQQAQIAFETALRNDVFNMVQNRRDIGRERESAIEAARSAALAGISLLHPLGQEETVQRVFNNAFDDIIETTGIELNERQAGIIGGLYGQLYESGVDPSSPEGIAAMQNSGIALGLDPEQSQAIFTALGNARQQIEARVPSYEGMTNLPPGGAELSNLLYDQLIEMGTDDNTARAIALSPATHQLIKMRSNGRVGQTRGGNLAGLGGIPLDFYESMNLQPGNAEQEAMAFLLYLQAKYGGDPVAALDNWQKNKDF